MTQFVSGDNDSGKSAGILDDGNGIDFFQPLVDDAGATYISESGCPSIAFSVPTLSSAHVKPENQR